MRSTLLTSRPTSRQTRGSTARQGRIFYGWWIVLACAGINLFATGSFFYGFTHLLEPITEHLNASFASTSLAFSLLTVEFGMAAPVTGFLADRIGPRKLLFTGALISGAGFILLSRVNSLTTFYLTFALIAVGMGTCSSVVMMTVVANWFHKKVGIAMGLMMAGFGLSGLLLPLIAWLVSSFGWQTTLVIMGIWLLALTLPLSLLVRDKPEPYGYEPDGGSSRDNATTRSALTAPVVEINPVAAIKSRAFWVLAALSGFQQLILQATVLHIRPFFTTIDIPIVWVGWLSGALPLISIVGRLGLGRLGDVIDRKYVLALCFGMMSAGMTALAFARSVGGVWFALGFFSVGYGGYMPSRPAMQRDYFGRVSFGAIQGLMMVVATAGGILGPWVAGRVFDVYGTYHWLWLAFAIVSAMLVPVVVLIRRPTAGQR